MKRQEMKEKQLADYYIHLRAEIVREDSITHQRITWLISFQGFLLSAMALLVVFGWPLEGMHDDIIIFRRIALGAICALGLSIAVLSYFGVRASHRSLENVKKHWERILSESGHSAKSIGPKFIPDLVPQAYYVHPHKSSKLEEKDDVAKKDVREKNDGGAKYAISIPIVFISMWCFFSVVYIIFVGPELLKNIQSHYWPENVNSTVQSNLKPSH